jgi:hypothetical protein
MKLDNKGQSAIEFVLTVAFTVALFFVFVNQAINFTAGYVVHYANFMVSRTYMTYDSGIMNMGNFSTIMSQAENYAKNNTLPKYQLDVFVDNLEVEFNSPETTEYSEFVGSMMKFTKPFSSFEFLGGGEVLELYTESFLGKEPTRVDCRERICRAIAGSDCNDTGVLAFATLYDNGC